MKILIMALLVFWGCSIQQSSRFPAQELARELPIERSSQDVILHFYSPKIDHQKKTYRFKNPFYYSILDISEVTQKEGLKMSTFFLDIAPRLDSGPFPLTELQQLECSFPKKKALRLHSKISRFLDGKEKNQLIISFRAKHLLFEQKSEYVSTECGDKWEDVFNLLERVIR